MNEIWVAGWIFLSNVCDNEGESARIITIMIKGGRIDNLFEAYANAIWQVLSPYGFHLLSF